MIRLIAISTTLALASLGVACKEKSQSKGEKKGDPFGTKTSDSSYGDYGSSGSAFESGGSDREVPDCFPKHHLDDYGNVDISKHSKPVILGDFTLDEVRFWNIGSYEAKLALDLPYGEEAPLKKAKMLDAVYLTLADFDDGNMELVKGKPYRIRGDGVGRADVTISAFYKDSIQGESDIIDVPAEGTITFTQPPKGLGGQFAFEIDLKVKDTVVKGKVDTRQVSATWEFVDDICELPDDAWSKDL